MKDIIITIACFGGLFLLIVVPIISMWVSIAKKGDERRKMILQKTCTETFIVHILMILIDILGEAFTDFEIFQSGNSISQVAVVCILFQITLFMNKRKYGN